MSPSVREIYFSDVQRRAYNYCFARLSDNEPLSFEVWMEHLAEFIPGGAIPEGVSMREFLGKRTFFQAVFSGVNLYRRRVVEGTPPPWDEESDAFLRRSRPSRSEDER